MVLPAVGSFDRRPPYPGAPFELSTLTLTVSRPSAGTDADTTIELLRRAHGAGVTTFDTAGAAEPGAAEALLARAFPGDDPDVVVMTTADLEPGRPLPFRSFASGLPGRGGSSRVPSGKLGPGGHFRRLYETDPPGAAARGEAEPGVSGREPSASAAGVALRCRSSDDVGRAALTPPPRLLSGAYSLLATETCAVAVRELGPEGFSWIARDPFAGGRLDGRRFLPEAGGAPTTVPRAVHDLEAEFAPVARLGFLALPHRRTLAQAALRFLVSRPWVATIVVPLPPPERWAEILGFRDSPPLTAAEHARIEALGADQTLPPAYPAVGGGR
jgi:aryl-alcohol dehydrogenase-like predicted oxidoreductase